MEKVVSDSIHLFISFELMRSWSCTFVRLCPR